MFGVNPYSPYGYAPQMASPGFSGSQSGPFQPAGMSQPFGAPQTAQSGPGWIQVPTVGQVEQVSVQPGGKAWVMVQNEAVFALRTTDNAICQIGYQNLQNTNALASQLAEFCCTTQRGIDSVKFDMANYSAATNATITAGVQKVLDKLCADQTAALQARVQHLELQQAVSGIPRTNPYGYGIYAYPACAGVACGCGTNI